MFDDVYADKEVYFDRDYVSFEADKRVVGDGKKVNEASCAAVSATIEKEGMSARCYVYVVLNLSIVYLKVLNAD